MCLATLISANTWHLKYYKTSDTTKATRHNEEELHTAERMGSSQVGKAVKSLFKLIVNMQRLKLTQHLP